MRVCHTAEPLSAPMSSFWFIPERKSQPRSGNGALHEKDIPGRLSQTFGLCARLWPWHVCATGFFVFSYSKQSLLLWHERQDALTDAEPHCARLWSVFQHSSPLIRIPNVRFKQQGICFLSYVLCFSINQESLSQQRCRGTMHDSLSGLSRFNADVGSGCGLWACLIAPCASALKCVRESRSCCGLNILLAALTCWPRYCKPI